MDLLKSQLSRIQQQLSGLSASQKMLAGALVVIMVMTLSWWSTFAGRSEMTVLLDRPMNPQEMSQISAHLSRRGISAKTIGDRIHVPADRKEEILADLLFMDMLPEDTSSAFTDLLAKSSPFDSRTKTDALLVETKRAALTRILKHLPNVRTASVLLDVTHQRGPNGTEPTATVQITTKDGNAADRLWESAAELVAGSVAKMRRSRVHVVVDGRARVIRDRDPDAPDSAEWMKYTAEAEKYFQIKILELFPELPNLKVTVSARPNFRKTETFDRKLDGKNAVVKPRSEETSTDDTRTSDRMSEPGVIPNGALSIDQPAGETSTATMERNKVENHIEVPSTEKRTTDPGRDVSVLSASVMIPRSFFVQSYRQATGSDKDPDITLLEPFIATQIGTWKKAVVGALQGVTEDVVHVDSYIDPMPLAMIPPQAASSSMGSIPGLLGNHGKEIALGALALVSLYMVSSMVRKSSPIPAAAVASAAYSNRSVPQLKDAMEDAVGEATETSPLLDAVELDPESVKTQEMLKQVGDLVGENPESAAALVKRWLNR